MHTPTMWRLTNVYSRQDCSVINTTSILVIVKIRQPICECVLSKCPVTQDMTVTNCIRQVTHQANSPVCCQTCAWWVEVDREMIILHVFFTKHSCSIMAINHKQSMHPHGPTKKLSALHLCITLSNFPSKCTSNKNTGQAYLAPTAYVYKLYIGLINNCKKCASKVPSIYPQTTTPTTQPSDSVWWSRRLSDVHTAGWKAL